MVTLCPDDFSKSGMSATIAGCKATAHRSLISAAFAVLPAVMPNKARPNAIFAEMLRMLRRFIVFSFDLRLRTRAVSARTRGTLVLRHPREGQRSFSDRNRACRRH